VRTIYNGGYLPTLALEDDKDSPWHGWLFFKHPDGEMVSLAKIEEVSEAPDEAAPDSQKLISNLRESLEIQERKIERLRELLQKASDYKDYLQSPEESPVWIWQGDGEDYPDSMANSLTVVIRADQLRALIHAVPDGVIPVPSSVIHEAVSDLEEVQMRLIQCGTYSDPQLAVRICLDRTLETIRAAAQQGGGSGAG